MFRKFWRSESIVIFIFQKIADIQLVNFFTWQIQEKIISCVLHNNIIQILDTDLLKIISILFYKSNGLIMIYTIKDINFFNDKPLEILCFNYI